jgi:hypothetical protein
VLPCALRHHGVRHHGVRPALRHAVHPTAPKCTHSALLPARSS